MATGLLINNWELKELHNDLIRSREFGIELGQRAVHAKQELAHVQVKMERAEAHIYEMEDIYHERLEGDLQVALQAQEKVVRADTLKRSRSVLRGQATEHLAPFMKEGLNSKDFRFMGSPIDYLVVNSGSAVLDGQADEVEVILMEIKTGESKLNKLQRRIRDAVVDGRVSFQTYNPDTDESRTWEAPTPSTS